MENSQAAKNEIVYNVLKKDEKWLYNKLNVKTKADLENILLAIYDQEEDTMNISKKNN